RAERCLRFTTKAVSCRSFGAPQCPQMANLAPGLSGHSRKSSGAMPWPQMKQALILALLADGGQARFRTRWCEVIVTPPRARCPGRYRSFGSSTPALRPPSGDPEDGSVADPLSVGAGRVEGSAVVPHVLADRDVV